jgi:hypothetical protein
MPVTRDDVQITGMLTHLLLSLVYRLLSRSFQLMLQETPFSAYAVGAVLVPL